MVEGYQYRSISEPKRTLVVMIGSTGRRAVQARGSEFDVFVSHASEDKAEVARPLTAVLVSRGLHVWLDEQVLTLGDPLGRKIDEGLARSRFGVVILSPNFFAKHWPRRELDGLAARETLNGDKVILPVWHGVTAAEVTAASPILAGRVAVDTAHGIERVADEVQRALEAADGERILRHFPARVEPHTNAPSPAERHISAGEKSTMSPASYRPRPWLRFWQPNPGNPGLIRMLNSGFIGELALLAVLFAISYFIGSKL